MLQITKEEIYARVNHVFREEFEDDSITVTAKTTANDIEDWDSLMHINLILSIEDEFGMRFTLAETTDLKNVGEMVDILQRRATK